MVSLNLCTDQMAHLMAAPGQLISVSQLGADPVSSAYADALGALPSNDGSAEGVVSLKPDLVLAGTFTTRATVSMLERLGIRVERFAPAASLEDVRFNLQRMGELLDRTDRAAALIDELDAGLAALRGNAGPAPRVALYYALGNTAGRQTLPGALLDAAGMTNIAAEKGLPFGGALPIESLVLSKPDLVLIGRPYGGHARATELLQHPALRATGAVRQIANGPAWSCETPALLQAVAELVALREDWEAGR